MATSVPLPCAHFTIAAAVHKNFELVKLVDMRLSMPLALFMFIAACEAPKPPPAAPVSRRPAPLIVAVMQSPPASEDVFPGIDRELASRFAARLGRDIRFVVAPSADRLVAMLRAQQISFAASGLSIERELEPFVRFGTPYLTATFQVISADESPTPDSFDDLVDRQLIAARASSAERVLMKARARYPLLHWQSLVVQEPHLLQRVAEHRADAAIVTSDVMDSERAHYPNLRVAFDLPGLTYLAWAFPEHGDIALYRASLTFFNEIQRDGTLAQLIDRYYGHHSRIDDDDIGGMLEKMRTTLPRFRKVFQTAQEESGLDWRLLAAIGYQESKWDPYATSPTGVRGIMMLTEQTADHLNVSNRLDPVESVPAAAQYFAELSEAFPDSVAAPDRTWLALAAYDVGYAHILDARALARQRGLDPDKWISLKTTLPLLAKPSYAAQAKYGACRGGEAVIFVESVRSYYELLKAQLPEYRAPLEVSDRLADAVKTQQRSRVRSSD